MGVHNFPGSAGCCPRTWGVGGWGGLPELPGVCQQLIEPGKPPSGPEVSLVRESQGDASRQPPWEGRRHLSLMTALCSFPTLRVTYP